MDGYELTKAIRKLDKSIKDIPIIGITSLTEEAEIKKATQAGMNIVLEKPLNFNVLKDLIFERF